MALDYVLGCPECSMGFGMHSSLQSKEGVYECASNPAHKFRKDEQGFLKSV